MSEEQKTDRSITSTLAIGKTGGLAFTNVSEVVEIARLMSKSQTAVPKHLRDNPGACLGVALQASEWEMSPYAVANKSYVVNDRIAYEAQMINAVILRRAPIKGRFKVSYSGEGNTRRCKVSATLTDGDVVEYESPKFSEITTKNSPLWKADPDQQMFYYSSRAMCRRHFPDVILGVYSDDEIDPERDVTPAPITFFPKHPPIDLPAITDTPAQERPKFREKDAELAKIAAAQDESRADEPQTQDDGLGWEKEEEAK